MHRAICILRAVVTTIFFAATTISAASKPIANVRTSYPTSVTQFDYDLTDTALYNPLAAYQLLYRDTASTTWNTAAMSLLYKACTSATLSTSVSVAPPSNTLEYFFRVESDSIAASQSPKNVSNVFPVSQQLLADSYWKRVNQI